VSRETRAGFWPGRDSALQSGNLSFAEFLRDQGERPTVFADGVSNRAR